MLPEPVRTRVVTLVAAAMSEVPVDELPPPLRKVAKFAPHRRARLGGAMIAAQLTTDVLFRQRVAAQAGSEAGELGTAVAQGSSPAAADPVEVAALAYLLRPAGWRELIEAAERALSAEADRLAVADQVHQAEARAAQAEHDRTVARVEVDKLRAELTRVRDELGAIREQHRATLRELRDTQASERRAQQLYATEKGRANRATADHEAELRRLRAKLAETEQAVGQARSTAREARSYDEARLWLLLETIGQAAVGLRRELALDPAEVLPGDVVADQYAQRPEQAARQPARAMAEDDPARLDQLLALPRVHLVVDGYNVTKRGYGELDLEQQRQRLARGLSGLAAQTGAEVTVAFDGSDRLPSLPTPPRGVRVLFSSKGETADELIRRLVRAEPNGRPVVVVSSDREVADGVRRAGAYPLPADALLRRLASR
ncbi:NYN domain-containing protein [Natronosporangium hydrolyticum]|nr:NYN domain-containing protein [Natronosporangium hydrolyticum]